MVLVVILGLSQKVRGNLSAFCLARQSNSAEICVCVAPVGDVRTIAKTSHCPSGDQEILLVSRRFIVGEGKR